MRHPYLEILLVGVEHAVKPGQKLLGAVVAVQDDGHAVVLGHEANVVGARHRPEDGGLLTFIRNALQVQDKTFKNLRYSIYRKHFIPIIK